MKRRWSGSGGLAGIDRRAQNPLRVFKGRATCHHPGFDLEIVCLVCQLTPTSTSVCVHVREENQQREYLGEEVLDDGKAKQMRYQAVTRDV